MFELKKTSARKQKSSTIEVQRQPSKDVESNPPQVYWKQMRGKFHAFPKSPEALEENECQEVMEFSTVGVVKKAYLRGSFAHTVIADIETAEIERIKAIVAKVPNFDGSSDYRWPFEDNEARFVCKEGLNQDFECVWDGRNIDIGDIDARKKLSVDEIQEGTKVFVEYAITPYVGRKSRPNIKGFEPGTSLELLSVGLLEVADARFDVRSPNKKRRTA
jgi:hypothetical protein